MSTSATLYNMQSTELEQAQLIYNQVTADKQLQHVEQWVMMESLQGKIFVIDTTTQVKQTTWVPFGEINNTTKVPLAFPLAMALRIKWMVNNLP